MASDDQSMVFRLSRPRRVLTHVVLILLCLPFALPLVWMVTTSLKTENQIRTVKGDRSVGEVARDILPQPVDSPAEWKWDNYPEALQAVPFGTYLQNTLLLCVLNVIGSVFSSAVVAYGFARLEFPGRDALFVIMIATMALPAQVTMVPIFAMFRALGWYGTLAPLFVRSFFGNPFFVFLLRQFFRTIPNDLTEAARIDGAGEWKIFWKVMLPLARPALAVVALFQFLRTWNDFFGPLLYINDPQRYTLAYGLQQFVSSYDTKWALLMAASCVFTIPIVILFFLAQKTFIQGIATTGGKG